MIRQACKILYLYLDLQAVQGGNYERLERKTCMICMVSVMDMVGNKMLKGFAVATVISLFTGVAIISIVAGQIVKPVSRLADMVEKREFTR